MKKTTKFYKSDIRKFINKFKENDSLMLTISEPHIRLKKFAIEGITLEPIIDEIIRLVNRFVFGKNKKYESLKGIVVEENMYFHPHYHIILKKPEGMEFDPFKRKLEQIAERLCEKDFILDLSGSNISSKTKERLSKPCYDKFAKVTEVHGNLDNYLTKQGAFYYILQGREFKRERDILELRVNIFFDSHHFGDFANNYV
ncbi:hypothetical protein [Nitrosomonas sp. Nm34]|uniref:hypothetical protein n=1 Tax=Nitrosomonas sp. Nm34 TaxID=1881055 RepID=UPI0008E2707D|nr:hypothetical protein [Nitrosomonas sp. Nm34]SFI39932.1 hypothetical protein SAMN05428978_100873 [Nitrosomonas sp. Nm34]